MTSFTIADSDLDHIKDQVVIVTGASSGIGLATVKRLVQHGAKVYASDVNPLPEPESASVPFLKVDVASWKDQVALFKAAKEEFGRIDHVFANAGISTSGSLVDDEFDTNGDLLAPNLKTIDVNLTGCIYTAKLAIHYLKQNEKGGSIVMTASASSYARFRPWDYTTAKHGVLGLCRSLMVNLSPEIPIRINALAPSWTATGIVPPPFLAALGDLSQPADVVARNVLFLMAGSDRHGECIYSEKGKYWDLENGEKGVHHMLQQGLIQGGADLEKTLAVVETLRKAAIEARKKEIAAAAAAGKQ